MVLGFAWFVRPSVKFFAEYIRVAGFAPLNFISGGNIKDEEGNVVLTRTHSERSALSHIFMIGINVAL